MLKISSKTHYQCPVCDFPLDISDVHMHREFLCTQCGTRLMVIFKYNWIYGLIGFACGLGIAYLQGFESVVLIVMAIIYGPILHIIFLRIASAIWMPVTIKVRSLYVQKLDIHV